MRIGGEPIECLELIIRLLRRSREALVFFFSFLCARIYIGSSCDGPVPTFMMPISCLSGDPVTSRATQGCITASSRRYDELGEIAISIRPFSPHRLPACSDIPVCISIIHSQVVVTKDRRKWIGIHWSTELAINITVGWCDLVSTPEKGEGLCSDIYPVCKRYISQDPDFPRGS